jgi:hypothetical protein
VSHAERVQREFTRQAESFAASAELNADELVLRIRRDYRWALVVGRAPHSADS